MDIVTCFQQSPYEIIFRGAILAIFRPSLFRTKKVPKNSAKNCGIMRFNLTFYIGHVLYLTSREIDKESHMTFFRSREEMCTYRVRHIYWPIFNDSPFLSKLTQEKVKHFFRKPIYWLMKAIMKQKANLPWEAPDEFQ